MDCFLDVSALFALLLYFCFSCYTFHVTVTIFMLMLHVSYYCNTNHNTVTRIILLLHFKRYCQTKVSQGYVFTIHTVRSTKSAPILLK